MIDDIFFDDIFFTDQPEINLSSAKKRIAKTIFDIIKNHNSEDYLSIALNGTWGSGKTTILEEVKRNLEHNYEVLWINFWKIETPEDTILELKKLFIHFIKKQFIFIPFPISLIIYNFFKIISSKGNNISEILQIFQSQGTKNLFKSENEFQKFLNCAFEYSKREKIVIIFDDIDRVLDRKDIFFFLKTICYVVGHNNIISITGIDINQTSSLISSYSDKFMSGIEMNQSNNSIQTTAFDYNDFIYKIFNTIIDTYNNQDDMFQFAKFELIGKRNNRLENFLESHAFNPDDKRYITKDISEFMIYTNINNLFINYREFKLSVNDFFNKLLQIKAERKGIYFEHMIKPSDIFLLCCLRNINYSIYSKLENDVKLQIDKYLGKEDPTVDITNITLHQIIKNLIKDNLLTKEGKDELSKYEPKDTKSKRPLRIFELVCERKLTGIDNKELNELDFVMLNSKQNSIMTRSALKFYFYPFISVFDYSTKEILKHLSLITENLNSEEYNKIIREFVFETFSDDYSNPDTFAWCERINNYLFRVNYVLRHRGEEDTEVRLAIINRIFICISKYIKDVLKLDSDTFDTVGNLMGLFNDVVLFREFWGNDNKRINTFIKYKDIIKESFFTNELLDTLISFATNTIYQKHIINAIKNSQNILNFILNIYDNKKGVDYKLKKEFRNYINMKIIEGNLPNYSTFYFSKFMFNYYEKPDRDYITLDKIFIIRIAAILKLVFRNLQTKLALKSKKDISEFNNDINQMEKTLKKVLKFKAQKFERITN